jgi:hypothetical protein
MVHHGAADENITVHRERALKKPVALLLGLAALGVAGAETAAAQGLYYYGPGFYGQRYYMPGLAPWRIARIVRSAGMTPLSSPTRRGPVYEVVAIDPEGRHVRVAVDAYRGAITDVRAVAVLRPNGEPYGSRVAVAPPGAQLPEQDDAVPGPRFGPMPAQPGAGRVPPQGLSPYGGPSQATPPQNLPPQAVQPPQAIQPVPNPRIATVPATTGATTPLESERTPIPRPRPAAAANAAAAPAPAAVPSSRQAPAAAPSAAAATAPGDVPEAPPAPIRARPSAPAAASAAAASASAKPPAPTGAANTSPATGTEPRPATTLVPVAPLE